MILKQHLDIGDLSFDIAIRKPPPVDEAGTHELDGWMRAIVGMIREANETGGEFAVWDQLSDEAVAISEPQFARLGFTDVGPGQPRGNFEVEV